MYNLKAAIRKAEVNTEGKVNIKIRLSAHGKTRYIPTEWWIDPDDWNKEAGMMIQRRPGASHVNKLIPPRITLFEEKLAALGNKFMTMSMRAIMTHLRGETEAKLDFYKFTEDHIASLRKANKIRSSEIYQTTINKVRKYSPTSKLDFRDINLSWLRAFQADMESEGLGVNAISFYMRHIRSMYNKAIDEEVVDASWYPFKKYKIKKKEGDKRTLTIDEMKRLRYAVLEGGEAIARDVFMLSFYLIGTNVKDLVDLRTIDRGRVKFHRAKTDRSYSIKVFPEASELIERYRGKKYLLRFNEHYYRHTQLTKYVNKHLKGAAKNKQVQIPYPLSTYYARYTWATIASGLDIHKDVIAQALGHGTSTLTDLYIDYMLEKVDEANERVIEAITNTSSPRP